MSTIPVVTARLFFGDMIGNQANKNWPDCEVFIREDFLPYPGLPVNTYVALSIDYVASLNGQIKTVHYDRVTETVYLDLEMDWVDFDSAYFLDPANGWTTSN